MKPPRTFLAWGLQDESGYPIYAIFATRAWAQQDEACLEELNNAKVVRVRVTVLPKKPRRKSRKTAGGAS